jgi:glycerol uptake facilitator-like aquaporin
MMTASGSSSAMTESYNLNRRITAELLGTAFLLATVVGSGIMGERLSGGNTALALLGNTLPTGAILVVLILIFGPISGAHFNPVVTLTFALRKELHWKTAIAYLPAQIFGAIIGVYAAHLMFAQPVMQISTKLRDGPAQAFSEFVATFGLIATILGTQKFRAETTPMAVGLYITAAYWFTASTSFANPAVTIARSLSNTFAGIAPGSVPLFIVSQCAGAAIAAWLFSWLLKAPVTENGR